MQRVASLMKQDCRKVQQIQSSLNNLRMADRDIDSTAQLFAIPGFPPVSGNTGSQDRRPYSLGAKQLFQPCGNVVLIGVNGKYLALAATRELGFHLCDECPLFCIRFVLVQIDRFGNDKRFAAFGFWVEFRAVQSAKTIRMVRPGQQSVQHGARYAAVSAMLLQAVRIETHMTVVVRNFHFHSQCDSLPRESSNQSKPLSRAGIADARSERARVASDVIQQPASSSPGKTGQLPLRFWARRRNS